MKIVYFDLKFPYLIKNDGTPTGGATIEWESWIDGFKQLGHKISIIVWKGAKEFVGSSTEYDLIEGIDIKNGVKILKWFSHRFLYLYKSLQKNKPDIIIQECANVYTGILSIIAKSLRVKFAYRVANDLDTDERYKKKLSFFDQRLFELGLRFTDYIIAQNQYQYENLQKKFPKKKIVIIHNPFKIKNDIKYTNILGREYIAWLGIFQYQKNLQALLQTVKACPNLTFKIAGMEDPGGIDKVTTNTLFELKAQKNVELVGFLKRNEIPDFLSKAYCLLNTSHFEGFSNTFLEAWSVGTPVVTTKNVNPDNLITKYKLGLIAYDYPELPNKINELINTQDYAEYVKRTYNYVKEHHDPKSLAKMLIDFIFKN